MTVSAATPISSAAVATNAATGSTATATSAQASATPTLSYNSFLTLLMAELKNQDPTQPMDPSQMVSQLATISEVGQAVQTNSSLSSLLTSTSLTQAEQLIGKSITSADGSTSGQVSSVTVNGSGATAILSNGQQVPLSNGATVGS
jgi:flagellar basal-body rod modification protein FlgD